MNAPRTESDERLVMAGIAALLLVVGGVLGVVTVLVPHSSGINDRMYLVLAGLGLAGAAIVWLLRERAPISAYQGVSAFGIVLVALSIYYSGSKAGGAVENELLFVWPILFAGYFFSRRGMALQLGIAALAYGAVLVAIDTGEAGIARWIGAMGTLVAAAVFVRYLKERYDLNLSLHDATIESTADGILVVGRSGRWESFNRNFLDMWNVSPEIVSSRDDNAALDFVLEQLEDPAGFKSKVRELYDTPAAESFDELRFKGRTRVRALFATAAVAGAHRWPCVELP